MKKEVNSNSYARLNLKIQLRNLVKSKSKFAINTFCIFLASLFSLFSGVVPIALNSFKEGEINSLAPFYSESNYAPFNNNPGLDEDSKYFNSWGYQVYDNHGNSAAPVEMLAPNSKSWSDANINYSPTFDANLITATTWESSNNNYAYVASMLDYWETTGSIGKKYSGYNDYSYLLNSASPSDADAIVAGIDVQVAAAASLPVSIAGLFVEEHGMGGFYLNAYTIASILKVESFLARETELSANVTYWKDKRDKAGGCGIGYVDDNWGCYNPITKKIDFTKDPNPYLFGLYTDITLATPQVEKIIASALGATNKTAIAFFSKWSNTSDVDPFLVDQIENHKTDPQNRESINATRGLGGLLVGISSYFAPYNVLIQVSAMQNNVVNLIDRWQGGASNPFPKISDAISSSRFFLSFGSLTYNSKINELFTKMPDVTVFGNKGITIGTNIYGLNQDSSFWNSNNSRKDSLNNLVNSGAYAGESQVSAQNSSVLAGLPGPWQGATNAIPVVVNESFYRQYPDIYKLGTTEGLIINYTSSSGEDPAHYPATAKIKIVGYIPGTFGPSNIFTSRQEVNALGFTPNPTQPNTSLQSPGCHYIAQSNKDPRSALGPAAPALKDNPISYSYCHIFNSNSINLDPSVAQYYYPAIANDPKYGDTFHQKQLDPNSPAYGDGKGYYNSILSKSDDVYDLDGLTLEAPGFNQSQLGNLIGAQVNVVPGGVKKAVIDNTVVILSLILYGIIIIFIAISLISFFLSARLIIDENKVSIAMMRTLGFKKMEILIKTLGGFFILTFAIFLIVVPIAYIFSRALLITVISRLVSTTDYINIGFNPLIFVIALATLCVFLSAVIYVAFRGIGKVDIIKILNA